MKEQIRNNLTIQQFNNIDSLTSPPQNPHTIGGEIFMAEEGQGEMHSGEQSASQPRQEIAPQDNIDQRIALNVLNEALSSGKKEKKANPQAVEAARKAWEREYIKGKTLSFEERQVVEEAIKRGISPKSKEAPKFKEPGFARAGSQEDVAKAREAWHIHNEGKSISESDKRAQAVLIAMGIPPGDAREKQAMIQLAGILQEPEIQREYIRKAGEIGKLISEHEIVRQKREEAHETVGGPRIIGQLSETGLSEAGIENEALLGEARVLNNLIQVRGPDLEILTRGLENVARLNGAVPADQKQVVVDRITQLIREAENNQRRQQIRQNERVNLYRETGQRRYSVRELLTNREARDWAVNNLFAGVDSRPHIQFQQAFNPLTYGAYYESLMDIIRNASIGRLDEAGIESLVTEEEMAELERRLSEEELEEEVRRIEGQRQRELAEDLQRYQAEIRVREPLHNVNSILYAPSVEAKPLFDFMQQFSSELGDLAHRMPGAREMMDLYEQALREDMMKNDGYLRPEAVLGKVERSADNAEIVNVTRGEAEEITKERFRERNRAERITIKTADGKSKAYERTFEDWEVDRIFTISRGMLLMSQRLITIAAESRLPKRGDGSQIGSLFLQDVIQGYSPYVHFLGKYGVTEKSLAAYLYKTGEGKNLLKRLGGIFVSIWSTGDLRKATEMLTEEFNPFEVLDPSEMRYLSRLNPNRAGDLFTWITWRLGNRPGMLTMSTDFLDKGSERMEARLGNKPAGVSEEDYKNEYANWIGTAVRLEKLRGRIENQSSSNPETRREAKIAIEEAKSIIKQMVKLQPHRLYLVSKDIRDRVYGTSTTEGTLTAEEKANISTILDNLSKVESAFFQNREKILDEGETFNTAIDLLNDPNSEYWQVIADTNERNQAISFRNKVIQDFEGGGSDIAEIREKAQQRYYDEFIFRRENMHGFVLWTGDVPVDEFNMSKLGPTGAFVRRARDGRDQAAAVAEEVKLLASLQAIKTPDQLIQALRPIYQNIASYDSVKAKQAIGEKLEGLAKFFAADWRTDIPIAGLGVRAFGRASMAEIIFGKGSPAWGSAELRSLLVQVHDAQMITDDKFNELKTNLFAGSYDITRDAIVTLSQLISIAVLIYLSQRVLQGK